MLAEIQTVSEYAKGISAPGVSNQPILNTKKKGSGYTIGKQCLKQISTGQVNKKWNIYFCC